MSALPPADVAASGGVSSSKPLPSVAGGQSSSYQPLESLAGAGGAAPASVTHSTVASGSQVHMKDLFGITIKVISASELMAKDIFTGSSDPYCKVIIDDQVRKTRVVKRNLEPTWNETFTFIFQEIPKQIRFEVKDVSRQ